MTKPSPWTAQRIELLKSIYLLGSNSWVALRINQETGSSFTRDAIIGKIWRDKLDQTGRVTIKPGKATAGPRKPHVKVWKPKSTIPTPQPVDVSRETQPLNLTIQELNDHHCRFPYGNSAPFLFCGQPTVGEGAWCRYHCTVVYNQRLGEGY